MDLSQREKRESLIIDLYQYDILHEIGIKHEIPQELKETIPAIDLLIEQNIYNMTLQRLSYLDRAIIRLATYELLYTETPTPVIINDAVEMTKKYCDLDDDVVTHRFNNALLDKIALAIRKEVI